MDLFIERRVFLQPNADADEYMTLVLVNTSSEPFDLAQVWLTIPVTDANSDALAVSDGHPGNPEWHAGEVQERFLVAIQPRGVIPPHEQRIIGAHILCRNRCTVETDRLTFRDPLLRGDLQALSVERVAAFVTVVFPPDDEKRRVRAPGARTVLSRAATWEFMPDEGHVEQMFACLEEPACSSDLADLDDGLAGLHEAIARDACGEAVDSAAVLEPLQRVFGRHGVAIPDGLAVLSDLDTQPLPGRQHDLRRALQECSRGRYRQIFSQAAADTPGQDQRRGGRRQPTGSRPDSAADADAGSADGNFSASDDFSEVHWRGHIFHFNRRQATAVAYLYRAHQRGTPELHEYTIEDHVGWAQGTLGQNFQKHDAWGTLIVRGSAPGTYRLDLPSAGHRRVS